MVLEREVPRCRLVLRALELAQTIRSRHADVVRRCYVRLAVEFRAEVTRPEAPPVPPELDLPFLRTASVEFRVLAILPALEVEHERGSVDMPVLLHAELGSTPERAVDDRTRVAVLE